MKDLEAVYDEKIAPLMQQILSVCKEHGISCFCEFQYSDDGRCTSLVYDQSSHPIFQFHDAISQCIEIGGINVDKFLLWLMKKAKAEGHTSMVLSILENAR